MPPLSRSIPTDKTQGYRDIEKKYAKVDELQGKGQFDDAKATFQEVLAWSKENLGPAHEMTVSVQEDMATFLAQNKHFGEAITLNRAALKAREDAGDVSRSRHAAQLNLARCLTYTGKHIDAVVHLKSVYEAKKKDASLGPNAQDTLLSGYELATCLSNVPGREQEACYLFVEVLKKQLSTSHIDPSHAFRTRETLADVQCKRGRNGTASQILGENIQAIESWLADKDRDSSEAGKKQSNQLQSQMNQLLTRCRRKRFKIDALIKKEKEKLNREKLEKERLEKERLEKERLENERLENERLEKERLEKERLEKERLEKERLEKERLEKERLEKEKLRKEKQRREIIAKEKFEKDKLEKERSEKEQTNPEKLNKVKPEAITNSDGNKSERNQVKRSWTPNKEKPDTNRHTTIHDKSTPSQKEESVALRVNTEQTGVSGAKNPVVKPKLPSAEASSSKHLQPPPQGAPRHRSQSASRGFEQTTDKSDLSRSKSDSQARRQHGKDNEKTIAGEASGQLVTRDNAPKRTPSPKPKPKQPPQSPKTPGSHVSETEKTQRESHDAKSSTTDTRRRTTSASPNSSSRLFTTPVEGSLFDVRDGTDSRGSRSWFYDLEAKTQALLEPLRTGNTKRIKIAVLDTGVDLEQINHWDKEALAISDVSTYKNPRIRATRDFLDESKPNRCDDLCGHGTHCIGVIRRVAPEANVYVARIALDYTQGPNPDAVAEAIRHAQKVWAVDIISLSFGFQSWIQSIETAIRNLDEKILVLAATSNYGTRRTMAFPASMSGVIGIHAADHNGAAASTNAPIVNGKDLSILGVDVLSCWSSHAPRTSSTATGSISRSLTGSSVATAVAVGVAGLVLEFSTQRDETEDSTMALRKDILKLVVPRLRHSHGMGEVFRAMAVSSGERGFKNIVPWTLLKTDTNESFARLQSAMLIRKAVETAFGPLG